MMIETATDDTTVRAQLAQMDTGSGTPRLLDAVTGEVAWTELTLEEYLIPSKLSGGRIALRIDLADLGRTEWATVEGDMIRLVDETGYHERGPYLRGVVSDAVEQQREGIARVRPVRRAETPLGDILPPVSESERERREAQAAIVTEAQTDDVADRIEEVAEIQD